MCGHLHCSASLIDATDRQQQLENHCLRLWHDFKSFLIFLKKKKKIDFAKSIVRLV